MPYMSYIEEYLYKIWRKNELVNSKFKLRNLGGNWELYFNADSREIHVRDFVLSDVESVSLPHDGISARIVFKSKAGMLI